MTLQFQISRLTFIIIFCFLFSCKTTNSTHSFDASKENNSLPHHPLDKFDFKSGKWTFEVMETTHFLRDRILENLDESENAWLITNKVWILNNTKLIQKLSKEFKCDLNKQCDGPLEYLFYIYKDNQYYKRIIFCDSTSFSLGDLIKHLKEVDYKEFFIENEYRVELMVDSLKKNNIFYTITSLYPETGTIDTRNNDKYFFELYSDINYKSTKIPKDVIWKEFDLAKFVHDEIIKLFPEIDSLKMKSVSEGSFAVRTTFDLNRPYIFDLNRLKESDLFSQCVLIPIYIIKTYD